MCGNVPPEECFAPLSAYARRVREVQEELRDLSIQATQVIMTSDETDEQWWDEVRAQGRLRTDHNREGAAFPILMVTFVAPW
ncbi:hypothetical protein A0H81_02011 [Grifola frondosa]|uniref:Uncharacterized protein n=1 Tax=Grifola frondosa TaxID=5627 RepID=A0A1C7MMZ6_GRIFR|nr:hypothetical protein A0H81_02011 [Grifola frondosa]